MMNTYAFSGFLLGLTCLFLGVLILMYGNKKSAVHLTFALQNISISIWGFSYAMASISGSPEQALFWWKTGYVGGFFVVVLLLHHVCLINNMPVNRALLALLYALAALLPVFAFTGMLGMRARYAFDSFYFPQFSNPVYYIYCVMWIALGVYITYLIIKAYRRSPDDEKAGLRLYSIAYITGLWGGATYFLPVFGVDIYPYGNFLIPLYCVVITYSILRHRLLDIEVIIKKTLVFAGLLAFVFAMLVLPTLVIQEYIFRGVGTLGRLAGLAISGVIIILTMRRLENFLVNVTDKYLFQKKYDYKELLKTFTAEVLTVLELDRLVNLTISKLTDIVKVSSCAVLLYNDEALEFDVVASSGIKDPTVKLIRPDGIVTFMDQTHGYILVKELRSKEISIPAPIADIIDRLNAELIIPMVLHDKVMGVLTLGKKKSDDEYSQDDLDILLPLARTLAIAISNAELFAELGKTQAEAAQKEKMAVIGTLSAGINHEICNPLGIARGQCEAFLLNSKDGLYKNKTSEELLQKASEIMAKVIKETDRATAITKKLSSFAKPAKGEAETVDIGREIDEVFGLVGYELKLEKIEFVKEMAPGLPGIFVDRKQLQEVLFNLIRNAGQAIGEKGRIKVRASGHGGTVTIDVQDSGSGIPPEKIKELFNPFFTTKEPGKGTGLGLFIVRQVVEKNGGRIFLKKTAVGEGTTFTLEFPAAGSEKGGVGANVEVKAKTKAEVEAKVKK